VDYPFNKVKIEGLFERCRLLNVTSSLGGYCCLQATTWKK